MDVVLGVGVLLALQQAANPLEFLFVAPARHAVLVLPVGGDAVLGGLVHVPGADLHLEGDALPADDRGVQGLVHVGLGGGDIVLEPARDDVEQVVDVAQDVVAVGDGVHDDPEGVQIIQLVDGLVLGLHLAIDGVDVLDAPVDGAVDPRLRQALGDGVLDGLHEFLGLVVVGFDVAHQLVVALGIEVPETGILQLPFDLLHAEAVGQRGVDVHGLHGFGNLLLRGLVLHGAGIVEPVGDLDEDHADVLAHGHEHLAQILHLLFLQGGILHPGQLGNAVDKVRHRVAEQAGDLVVVGVGVLDAVVQQGAEDGVGVQTDLRHDLRHRQGMDDIGRAVLPLLVDVLVPGVFHGPVHELHIDVRRILFDGLYHRVVSFLKGFHGVTSLPCGLSDSGRCCSG